jgi:hypothetical protein
MDNRNINLIKIKTFNLHIHIGDLNIILFHKILVYFFLSSEKNVLITRWEISQFEK